MWNVTVDFPYSLLWDAFFMYLGVAAVRCATHIHTRHLPVIYEVINFLLSLTVSMEAKSYKSLPEERVVAAL